MKKLLALLLCAVLCLSLAACASNTATTTTTTEPAASTETAAETPAAEETAEAPAEEAPDAKQYVVGICQLVQHDALDAATNGFMDALNEALPGQVTFDLKNASNDIPTCGTIVTGFVASNVDLILANATPALQAASTATQTIPILGTAVTEYGVALDIKDFNGTVGGNISGTSDLAPLDQQADMLLELLPEAQNVGILYCSAEANSVYQADVVKAALEEKGVTVTVYTFADSNDVATVTQTACAENDALYIPTDNTAASCTEAINNVAEPAGVPIVAGGLMTQFQGTADVSMGRGAIVIGLAAIIIGEVLCDAIFRKGCNFAVRLLFVVFGGVVYYAVMVLILWLKLDPNDLKLFTALIVAIFLAVPYLREQRRSSFARSAKGGSRHA